MKALAKNNSSVWTMIPVFAVMVPLLVAGCAENPRSYGLQDGGRSVLVDGGTAASRISTGARLLAERLTASLPNPATTSIVSSFFVDEDDIHRTTSLGRSISSDVVGELVSRGYRITEPRLSRVLRLSQSSESILSGAPGMGPRVERVQYALVGTIGQELHDAVVRAKIVRVQDGVIVAQASVVLEDLAVMSRRGPYTERETLPIVTQDSVSSQIPVTSPPLHHHRRVLSHKTFTPS